MLQLIQLELEFATDSSSPIKVLKIIYNYNNETWSRLFGGVCGVVLPATTDDVDAPSGSTCQGLLSTI